MNFYKKIMNLGARETDSPEFLRKIHLINQIEFISTGITFFFIFHLLLIENYFYIPFQTITGLLLCICYFLNLKRYHTLSFYWMFGVILINVFYCSIESSGAGVEYFFIPLGLIPIVIFKNNKICIGLVLVTFVAFIGSYITKNYYTPHVVLSAFNVQLTFIISITNVFLLCAIIIFQFKTANEKYENIISNQKEILSHRNKEITDSINYAKRIQDAIHPSPELIQQKLPDTFVLYKPKDIVAGDFYWMEEINDTIFIAAADCTGHGVPGAIVSVVCSNALNRAVKEFNLFDTGKILDKVTDIVLETFEKSVTEVKDGMDISMLSINKKTKKIQWSGANNPLWYFENSELKEITADKQPIGKSDHRKPFTTHAIEYKPATTFYLFTDGYADQFGGPKGKKFKYKQFQETISATLQHSPTAQQKALNSAFENWKGELEQVDDVCVIGIKL